MSALPSSIKTPGVLFIAALMIMAMGLPVTAGNIKPQITHKGILLIGLPAKPGGRKTTKYLKLKDGLQRIAKAIDVIYAESSFSAQKLETLKKNGQVIIVYYPGYQEEKIGDFALASFFPNFFKRNSTANGAKRFLVVVGPHAIKWPAKELAMIVVHELVGHGIQHLRGRLEYIRVLDLECAANLYGERFYQDIKIDKKANDIINFRKGLERHWCSDFKAYMRKHNPSQLALWDVLNPDVPELLALFDDYVNDLRQRGISGKAIKAAKELSKSKSRAD